MHLTFKKNYNPVIIVSITLFAYRKHRLRIYEIVDKKKKKNQTHYDIQYLKLNFSQNIGFFHNIIGILEF